MRTRRVSDEHREAVSRRLAQLSAELAAVRAAPEPEAAGAAEPWWEGHTRVRRSGDRPDPPAPEPPVGQPGAPAAVPLPGRHAARRRGRTVEVLPPTLRGRVALGAPQVAVLAVLVALGLAVTCWWVVRGAASGDDVVPVAAPAGSAPLVPAAGAPAGSGAAGSTAPAPADASPTGMVTVDVAGKVRRPGIAVLPAGSRVVDALEAAGGARAGVDLSTLNLARPLVDGEQVLVGISPAPGVLSGPTAAVGGAATPGVLVDLNTATRAQLEALPDVGPVTAQAILTWREEHGGFTAVDELLEVDGIGEATLATIAPHVTV